VVIAEEVPVTVVVAEVTRVVAVVPAVPVVVAEADPDFAETAEEQ